MPFVEEHKTNSMFDDLEYDKLNKLENNLSGGNLELLTSKCN